MATNPRDQAYQFYLRLGYQPHQAAAIVGSLQQESNFNPRAVGDQGTAFGMGQWRHGRFDKLKQFANARGTSWDDFGTQLAYLDWEMRNTERKAGDKLRSSSNINQALNAAYDFWRPAASRQVETQKRYRYAAPLLKGQPTRLTVPPPDDPTSRPAPTTHPDVLHGLRQSPFPSQTAPMGQALGNTALPPIPQAKPVQPGFDWQGTMAGLGGLLEALGGGKQNDAQAEQRQAFLTDTSDLDDIARRRRAWNQSFSWL